MPSFKAEAVCAVEDKLATSRIVAPSYSVQSNLYECENDDTEANRGGPRVFGSLTPNPS